MEINCQKDVWTETYCLMTLSNHLKVLSFTRKPPYRTKSNQIIDKPNSPNMSLVPLPVLWFPIMVSMYLSDGGWGLG